MTLPAPGDPDAAFDALMPTATQIGQGTSRDVYALPTDSSVALKVARPNCETVNLAEVEVWNLARPDQRAVLASVITWSASYKYVVMERLTPLTNGDSRGAGLDITKIITLITDFKDTNKGIAADGTIKMLDFAFRKDPVDPTEGEFAGVME